MLWALHKQAAWHAVRSRSAQVMDLGPVPCPAAPFWPMCAPPRCVDPVCPPCDVFPEPYWQYIEKQNIRNRIEADPPPLPLTPDALPFWRYLVQWGRGEQV